MHSFSPLMGTYIPSPRWLTQSHAALNIKPGPGDEAESCFLNSIYAALFPKVENRNKAKSYRQHRGYLNESAVHLPVKKSEILRFERLNDQLSINIFALDYDGSPNKKPLVYPYRISPNRGQGKTDIDLLLLESDEDDCRQHLVLILDLAKLVRSNATGCKVKHFCCRYCLQLIKKNTPGATDRILHHESLCRDFEPVATTFPPPGTFLEFKDWPKRLKQPFVIIYDTETKERVQQTVENRAEDPLPPDQPKVYGWCKFPSHNSHASTCRVCRHDKPCVNILETTHKHAALIPISIAYMVLTDYPEEQGNFGLRQFHGDSCEDDFLAALKKDLMQIHRILHINRPVVLSALDWTHHIHCKNCEICNVE